MFGGFGSCLDVTAFNLWHMSRSGQYKSQVNSLCLCFLWKDLGVCNARSLFMGDIPDGDMPHYLKLVSVVEVIEKIGKKTQLFF